MSDLSDPIITASPSYKDLLRLVKRSRREKFVEIRFVHPPESWHLWLCEGDYMMHDDYCHCHGFETPRNSNYGYIYYNKITATVTWEPYNLRHEVSSVPEFVAVFQGYISTGDNFYPLGTVQHDWFQQGKQIVSVDA